MLLIKILEINNRNLKYWYLRPMYIMKLVRSRLLVMVQLLINNMQ